LLNDPALLLADEARAISTRRPRKKYYNSSISTFEGKTIVVVTHDRNVGSRADRILHLKDGRVLEIEETSRFVAKKG